MLQAAELAGLEGVVAKQLNSVYRPGKRSPEWTKIPLVKTQEVIVIGWTQGAGRRVGLPGSLLLAAYNDQDQLRYAGHVGTGFTDAMLRKLQHELGPLAPHRSPPMCPASTPARRAG